MELMTNVIRVLFVLFLIYTVGYIIQWLVGVLVALGRFSTYHTRQQQVRELMPDSVCANTPVSAVIPAYNEQDCILATVESLIQDDYPNLEILVVDDGSSDETARRMLEAFHMVPDSFRPSQLLPTQPIRVCYRAEAAGKQIRLICKENGGKSDALNCGLNFCGSSHCLILDADTKVEPGSVRMLLSTFLLDPKTIVSAGAVRNSLIGTAQFRALSFFRRCLVRFQALEYYRTFYMQRILFDRINANLIVSGAFAMFDVNLVRAVGGYRSGIIGEDMELTMRLHAFCHAQKRPYHIAAVPEARCCTQVPHRYVDFIRQRRRWHIGMIQSLQQHGYMIGSRYYGWAGIMTGTFVLIYELLAPVIELIGAATLLGAYLLNILNPEFVLFAMLMYALFIILTQLVFLWALRMYGIEPISFGGFCALFGISLAEIFLYHPMNLLIKLYAFLTFRRNRQTWGRIRRSR